MGQYGEPQSVECTVDHAIVNMTGDKWTHFGGHIQCPAWDDVCAVCPNDCSGHGFCSVEPRDCSEPGLCSTHSYKCVCDEGCKGYDCSQGPGCFPAINDDNDCKVQDPAPYSIEFNYDAWYNRTNEPWSPDLSLLRDLGLLLIGLFCCICVYVQCITAMQSSMEGPDPDKEKLGPPEQRLFQDLVLIKECTFEVDPTQEGRVLQLKELTLLKNLEDIDADQYKNAKQRLLDVEAARARHKAIVAARKAK